MSSVVAELIKSLRGADSEASDLAFALSAKGQGEMNPSAPTWHPSHPEHPWRDAWQDQGNDMWNPESHAIPGQVGHLHPLADRAAAYERARAVQRNDSVVRPANRLEVMNDSNSPVNPHHPGHSLYLANPTFFHQLAEHDEENPHPSAQPWANAFFRNTSVSPNHPANPSHPDHLHFLEAHSRNHFGWDLDSMGIRAERPPRFQ